VLNFPARRAFDPRLPAMQALFLGKAGLSSCRQCMPERNTCGNVAQSVKPIWMPLETHASLTSRRKGNAGAHNPLRSSACYVGSSCPYEHHHRVAVFYNLLRIYVKELSELCVKSDILVAGAESPILPGPGIVGADQVTEHS